MFIDSHCHLDFPELAGNLQAIRAEMVANAVTHALCVSVSVQEHPGVLALAERFENFVASAGVHPDHSPGDPVRVEEILRLAKHPKVVAIGETGLDYYRQSGDMRWQQDRFRAQIRAARECGKPLIVHTRSASADTIRIMTEEGAAEVGGVMHCFTESLEIAERAIEMGFHISFSGIVTFRNAQALKDVARTIPGDRLLIETDAPYLAPVPFRGRVNRPGLVIHVAEELGRLRGESTDRVGQITSENFLRLFRLNRN